MLRGILDELAAGEVETLLVNVEDLWDELEPQNVPGTSGEGAHNWVRRARHGSRSCSRGPAVRDTLERIDDLRRRRDTRMTSLITPDDLHYFAEGTHGSLAARARLAPAHRDGVAGTTFAVWAPNAAAVSVIGDFNGWNRDAPPARRRRRLGHLGGLRARRRRTAAIYKYHVVSRHDGYRVDKADPFALCAELPPKTASVVWNLDYDVERRGVDGATRGARNALGAPISVYEVHLGSWRRSPTTGAAAHLPRARARSSSST